MFAKHFSSKVDILHVSSNNGHSRDLVSTEAVSMQLKIEQNSNLHISIEFVFNRPTHFHLFTFFIRMSTGTQIIEDWYKHKFSQ